MAGGKPFIFDHKIRFNWRLSTLPRPLWGTCTGVLSRLEDAQESSSRPQENGRMGGLQ